MQAKWIVSLPLAALVAASSSVGIALPVLSELYYDAVGSDDGESFVELYGAPGTLLDGLAIDGINGSNGAVGPTILLSGTIGASGLFVVADRRTDGTSSVVGADLLANFDFQNGPDSVVLRRDATVLDALGYGEFAVGEINAGEGAPAPGVGAGASLARRFANVDTDDNAADFVALASPTPGSAPLSAVPEPGSALLLGLGLGGLATANGRPVRRGCGRRASRR
ncbi:MAG: PEP-CTERM sorting domain-containing protein [Myxococcota bacterium]